MLRQANLGQCAYSTNTPRKMPRILRVNDGHVKKNLLKFATGGLFVRTPSRRLVRRNASPPLRQIPVTLTNPSPGLLLAVDEDFQKTNKKLKDERSQLVYSADNFARYV